MKNKPYEGMVGMMLGAAIILLLLPLLILDFAVLFGDGLPELGGVGYYLNQTDTKAYPSGELVRYEADADFAVGDCVVYKQGKRYLIGEVSAVVDGEKGRVAAVRSNDDGVTSVPCSSVLGKTVSGDKTSGAVLGFLGKYKIVFSLFFVMLALIELADVFISLRKSPKDEF